MVTFSTVLKELSKISFKGSEVGPSNFEGPRDGYFSRGFSGGLSSRGRVPAGS